MDSDRRTRKATETTESAVVDNREYEAHLERSRTVWDRWSDWYTLSERDFEPMREDAMDRLELQPGDRVLDIGCGPGVNFERLRNEIGPDGELVAVDYSPEMVVKARKRVEEHGWKNVEVRRADAARAEFDVPFDGAIATLSMSVMADIRDTAETIYRALTPDSRFVVFDVRPVPDGPTRVFNPVIRRFLRWYANWNPDESVIEAFATVFDECAIVATYNGGCTYTTVCEKRNQSAGG
ncbi:class I SAM-dependent methyltransferase [Natronorubrum daqingense]|uniref:Methyltransferase domain-containing protein n=1 Tax=Natronorubrum daqingense TaxID=588898 RepID=A0A1N7C131_9EURY|nr:methyltransferase domain-containing protein [Natronorubrum daqingense]APX96686.1 methyltransferase type 11 [Natronorubrum daqingense]SIR57272.1 Methyltransferase domain-containing protein [Natronorubrum daqingense]